MWKYAFLCLLTVGYCAPLNAQGKAGLLKGLQNNSDEDNARKDVEGVVWEFKVIEPDEKDRSTKTKMTGLLRIKQKALFAVGEIEYTNNLENEVKENKDDGKTSTGSEPPAKREGGLKERVQGKTPPAQGEGVEDIKNQAKGVLSQRLKQQSELQTGSERIGDLLTQNPNEYIFRFDEDDDHPLSGRATLRPDKTAGGGVWRGRYEEFAGGKKKKTWRIEMRKVEE